MNKPGHALPAESESVNARLHFNATENFPQISDEGLESIHQVPSHNQYGDEQTINIVGEVPLTIKVDGQELVTLVTLGTHPEKLVLGYLRNQTLFDRPGEIKSIVVNRDRELAEVTTLEGKGVPGFDKLKRTVTTGCGQGTILSCTLDKLYDHRLPDIKIKQSDIYNVLKNVSRYNNVYRQAGSVHGCALCQYSSGKTVRWLEVQR